MRPRSLLWALLLAACAPPPPPPVVSVAPAPPPPPAAPPTPCEVAAKHRARVPALLQEGRLQRTLRVLAHADALCPTSVAESDAPRAAVRAELDRDPAAPADALLRAAASASGAEAQRLRDRALAALERREGGVELVAPNGLPGSIRAATLLGAGKAALLAAAHGRWISVLDATTGDERWSRELPRQVESLAASPDGKTLAGTSDEALHLWNAQTGEVLLRREGRFGAVAWSADGKTLVVGDDAAKGVQIWSAEARTLKKTLTAKKAQVKKGEPEPYLGLGPVAVSAKGDVVALGLNDGSVRIFRVATGAESRRIQAHKRSLYAVSLSANGKLVATADNNEARLFDATSGKTRQTFPKAEYGIAFDPEGKSLVVTTNQGLVFHAAATGAEVQRLGGRRVQGASFDAKGDRVLTVTHDRLSIWDHARGVEELVVEPHARMVSAGAWLPDGGFATAGWDDRVRIWDAEKGAPRRILKDEDTILGMAVSPDGKRIATGTTGPTATIWDAESGTRLHVFPDQPGWVRAVAFSRSGKLLAFGGGTQGSLVDVDTGNRRAVEPVEHEIASVAFPPDEKTVAFGTQGSTLHVFEAASGRQLQSKTFSNAVSALTWSQDGARLLVGESEVVTLDPTLSVPPGAQPAPAQEGYVSALTVSPRNSQVVSGCSEGFLRAWGLDKPSAQQKVRAHDDLVTSIAVRPDGALILSTGDDGSARLALLDGSRAVTIRGVGDTDDAYAFVPGVTGRVELFGAGAKAHLRCRFGNVTYPFAVCADRFETSGLVAWMLGGAKGSPAP